MSDHVQPSYWDRIPSELILLILGYPVLSTLDRINFAQAYPVTIRPIIMATPSLWNFVHLPYPDPSLFNYPGWQRCENDECGEDTQDVYPNSNGFQNKRATVGLDTRSSSQRYQLLNPGNFYHEDRHWHVSEPEFFGLCDMQGGEYYLDLANPLWIILDVLDSIPLEHVRHLSIDSPPCLLCVYPCPRFCSCECHQQEAWWASIELPQSSSQRSMEQGYSLRCMDRHPQIPAFAHIPASPSSTDAGEDDIPSPSSPGLRTHLGQKLRDLVASGLVDFRQHVDVSSLRHVLNLGNPSDMLQPPEVEVHGYGGQLQRRSIVYRPLLSSPSETTVLQRTPRSDTFNSNNEDRQREERAVPMDGQPQVMVHPVDDVFTPMELNLDEALHQLHLLDMEEQWRERDTELWQFQALEDGHALQQLGAEAPSVASTEISVPFDGEVSTVTPHGGEPASVWTSNEPSTATSTFSKGTEGTNDIDDEQYQEMERQHAEARAAYQRAQLLIRILSSGQFQFLETLLVPWWPATQIFTICQQLEKWSRMAVMTQEAKNGPSNSLGTSNSLSTGKWRRRWTNELARKSCGYMMDRSSNGNCRYTHQPYLESNDMPVQRPSMTSITSPSFQQSTPSFPLASLRAFRLLSGGELKDYEVKCLGASALILSGYATVICAPSKAPSLSERLADTTSHEMQMQQVQNLISYFGHVELISHQEQQPHHQHQRTTSPMVCVSNMAYNTTKAVFEYCNICGVQYLNLEGSF